MANLFNSLGKIVLQLLLIKLIPGSLSRDLLEQPTGSIIPRGFEIPAGRVRGIANLRRGEASQPFQNPAGAKKKLPENCYRGVSGRGEPRTSCTPCGNEFQGTYDFINPQMSNAGVCSASQNLDTNENQVSPRFSQIVDGAYLFGSVFDIAHVFLYNEFVVPCFPINCYVCTQDCRPTRKQGTQCVLVPKIWV